MRNSKLTIVASFPELVRRAKALGDAKKSGDLEKIRDAQKLHDDYYALCLNADRLISGVSLGELY